MKSKSKNPYLSKKDKFDIKLPLTTMNLSEATSFAFANSLACENIGLMWVNAGSSSKLKRYVHLNAVYFRREFGYDFVQYSEYEDDLTHHAFLFLSTANDKYYDKPIYRILGGGCFRLRKYNGFSQFHALQWVWIHPYMRRKGILTKAFDEFMNKFECFEVEAPLSVEMKRFLEKGGSAWKIKDKNTPSKDLRVVKAISSSHELKRDDDYFEQLKNGVPVWS
jgi:hypothetical protein